MGPAIIKSTDDKNKNATYRYLSIFHAPFIDPLSYEGKLLALKAGIRKYYFFSQYIICLKVICFKYYEIVFCTMLFVSLTFRVDFIGRKNFRGASHLFGKPHIGTFRQVLFMVDSRRLGGRLLGLRELGENDYY